MKRAQNIAASRAPRQMKCSKTKKAAVKITAMVAISIFIAVSALKPRIFVMAIVGVATKNEKSGWTEVR